MFDEPMKRPTPRHLEPGTSNRSALDLVVQYLQESHHEADLRPDAEVLNRRQRLHRQPWRRPRRTAAESVSTLELVRRFQARHLAH